MMRALYTAASGMIAQQYNIDTISNNLAIVGPSTQLGLDMRNAFQSATDEPPSNYTGQDGIVPRSDLGGLDLSTVPKVLQGIATGLEQYLQVAERT